MAGSAAYPPATPGSLRASDAERDQAVEKLRQEFVEGRLSLQTFVFRMQSALGARDRAQLAGLFTDLPPRRARPFWPADLIARVRAAFGRRDPSAAGLRVSRGGEPGGASEARGPEPLFFPPGSAMSFTIGRSQECDLRIADMSVSRLHARLARSGDGWLLSDLGSHNGTRVNGWLVREPIPVRAGDALQFGSALFVIQSSSHPALRAGPASGSGVPGSAPR